MRSERFVVLGLARVRSPWFGEVSRWATSAVLPIDFVKCVSLDELRSRLGAGRAFSAVLADADVPGLDRDVVEQAREIGCAVILVDSGAGRRDHRALGVSALLDAHFDRDDLLRALEAHAARIGSAVADTTAATPTTDPRDAPAWRGQVFAVTGAGGTGTSVAAIALAHGLAQLVRAPRRVLLADLALDADQAMLHDARDIVPGVQELTDAFRHGTPSADDLLALTFGDGHPYRVLLGLRRHQDWTALRPRAWVAALDGLRRAFTHVVADIEADLEGEASCGSFDVEDRNLLARSTVDVADVVCVTAHPGVQGIHRVVRVVTSLVEHGVAPERVLVVINRAPRALPARAELTRTVNGLLGLAVGDTAAAIAAPIFVGEQRRLDRSLRDGTGPPSSMANVLAQAVLAVSRRDASPHRAGPELTPAPIVPGSLGAWATSQEAAG